MKYIRRFTIALSAVLGASISTAQAESQTALTTLSTRVIVTIENLAPQQGTFQTPFWVGFHDGSFDTYDGNTPANSDPFQGSIAMESICEDGNTGPISEDFAALVINGIDATLPGPNGPIAPGDIAYGSFVLDPTDPAQRYFSYASMIIPSNDFCISNGNPLAHPVFDDNGNFIATSFFVSGNETLDAGTEVNDELPQNTAFFGQQTPNTGVDENGLIGTLGSDLDAIGFMPIGSGGILDDPRFMMADFLVEGYPLVKISFASAPAIVDDLSFSARLDGNQEVPPVKTNAKGNAWYDLKDDGTRLSFKNLLSLNRNNITMAHLHLAPAGENGPVVAFLFDDSNRDQRLTKIKHSGFRSRIKGDITSQDLTGPLTGQPLDALIAEIEAGNVYINIHTVRNPAGQLRGQLK